MACSRKYMISHYVCRKISKGRKPFEFMKNHSQSILLLFLILLISCNGCKKQTEIEEETIPKAPACLIATQTTKELVRPSQQFKLDMETVIIGNETFQVSTTKKSVYRYDTKGRILTEYNSYTDGHADSVCYQYKSGAVTIRTIDIMNKTFYTEVAELNRQGLAEKLPDGNQATYDQDGYYLTYKNKQGKAAKIDNGNTLENEIVGHDGTPNSVFKSEYDLSKASLPFIRSFYGKIRNLRTSHTIDQNGPFGVYPEVYSVVHKYIFGDEGRIMRQILRGKDGHGPVKYIWGGDQVIVNDFSYVCP